MQPSNYIVSPPLQLGGSCGLKVYGKNGILRQKKKREALDDIGIMETAYSAGYYRSAQE